MPLRQTADDSGLCVGTCARRYSCGGIRQRENRAATSLRLTLRELEALAGFGLTRLLALHDAGVAGHEAFGAECGLVFRIDLDKSAGDGQTQSLGLSFVAAAVDVGVDVIFVCHPEGVQRLKHYILKDR